MLSHLGLRSIDVLTAPQQLLKHPACVLGPTVSGHRVVLGVLRSHLQPKPQSRCPSIPAVTLSVLSRWQFLLFYQEARPTCPLSIQGFLSLMSLVTKKGDDLSDKQSM